MRGWRVIVPAPGTGLEGSGRTPINGPADQWNLPTGQAGWRSTVEEFKKTSALTMASKQVQIASTVAARFLWRGIASPADITPAAVQDHLAALSAAGKSRKTIINARSALSTFCRFLVVRGLLASNPVAQVRSARPELRPARYLAPQECLETLRAAEKAGIGVEVALALATGLRLSELQRLAWADCDLHRRILAVQRSKSGRPRYIPLSAAALAALRCQVAVTGHMCYVFPAWRFRGRQKILIDQPRCPATWGRLIIPLQRAVPAFAEGTGAGRGWHLLRHTFASRLAQAGVSLYKLAQWLGHGDVRTTTIYAHLAADYDEDIDAGTADCRSPQRLAVASCRRGNQCPGP